MAQHPAAGRALLRLSLQYQCGRRQDIRAGARNGGESDRGITARPFRRVYPGLHQRSERHSRTSDRRGTRVTSIPKYTGSLAVSYETMLAQDYKLTFRLAESYVGPVYDTAYYAETLGSYGLMDFRMGVGKERMDGVLVRHQFGRQTRWTDHRQYGLRVAAADDHCVSRPISRAPSDWRSRRSSRLARGTTPRIAYDRGAQAPRFS